MKESRTNIIGEMRKLDIVEVVLCLDKDTWLKEHPDCTEDDYDWYFYDEVPTVIHFGKYDEGREYRVMSVKFEDCDDPHFILNCEDDNYSRETFADWDVTPYSMIGVYEALEKALGLK